jgi:hypothetical protein
MLQNLFNHLSDRFSFKNEKFVIQEAKNYLDIDTQIDLNLKQIEFYHSMYEKNQNKFSFLVIIYSFICFYLLELTKYVYKLPNSLQDYIYLAAFICLIYFLFKCINKTYSLLKPIEIAYLNQPQFFYKELFHMYQQKLIPQDEAIINEYIKASYLEETETVLSHNISVYQKKSKNFYDVFKTLFITFIIYIFLASYVFIQKKDEKPTVVIENYKEIFNYKDSIMSKTEKPKVDPSQVIRTQPVMIKESINLNAERKNITDRNIKTEKPNKKE